jgi:hypothetical protein
VMMMELRYPEDMPGPRSERSRDRSAGAILEHGRRRSDGDA